MAVAPGERWTECVHGLRPAGPWEAMCESSVYLIKGSDKALVMDEVVRVSADGPSVVCVNTLGERKVIDRAEIAEASLARHEILLRPRRG